MFLVFMDGHNDVTFVLMVNCCEVLSVCIKLFWEGGALGWWHGAGWEGWEGLGGVGLLSWGLRFL